MVRHKLTALEDRGPLRVMFLITSMPVGGAETLLVNLIRRLDRDRFQPSLACLKSLGPLGETLALEIPAYDNLIRHKFDVGVIKRLAQLFRDKRIDAVVTVGAGDKMFWGRLAARRASVPVMLCALHSTGWPDSIGRLNRSRLLTHWTDGFIGVANAHAIHLVEREHFPLGKVFVIPNGVNVDQFDPSLDPAAARRQLNLPPEAPVAGIVAALRPEKNHELFLQAAARVREQVPGAQFIIVGDGPLRSGLEDLTDKLRLPDAVHFLGTRHDIPRCLAALDAFVLTSRMEANPVSILEAMAMGKPVVAPRVGSIDEAVRDGITGFLTPPDDLEAVVNRTVQLLSQPEQARDMGRRGRQSVVENWSLAQMVGGYQDLITALYAAKAAGTRPRFVEPAPAIDATVEQVPLVG